MSIGIFSVIFHNLRFEKAMDKIADLGFGAVEVSTGGNPGICHCPVDELLESESKRKAYLKVLETRRLLLSALNCSGDLLSPDRQIARASIERFCKMVELAQRLEVPAVNVMSGLPSGAPATRDRIGSPVPGRRISWRLSATSGNRWASLTGARQASLLRLTE